MDETLQEKLAASVDAFVDKMIDEFFLRLGRRVTGYAQNNSPPSVRTVSSNRGHASGYQQDMHCRVAGCRNRSKGPRNHYMCEVHMKLPVAEQRKALVAYREKA